jgi:LPXTG-site transpeptidase (sortase) family protein
MLSCDVSAIPASTHAVRFGTDTVGPAAVGQEVPFSEAAVGSHLMAHRRAPRRRLRRALRRLSRLQYAVILAMLLAVAAGSVGLVLLLRGPAPAPAYPVTAPPLALGSNSPGTATSLPAAAVLTTRLIIPAGGIDIPVIQGDGVSVPLHFAIHYPGTDQPGGGSNALYYGHAQPGMFQGLYRVHQGDEIQAVRSDGTELVYKVAVLKKVAFNDRSVLQPSKFDEITLLTCTSYDPYTPRYIVIGLPA